MKTFLIKYRRSTGAIEALEEIAPQQLRSARAERLQAEIDSMRSGGDIEIVLIEAPSLDVLRRTHSRYFKNASELLAELAPTG